MNTTTTQARRGGSRGLLERFHGDVITPQDERYEAARTLWNAAVDKRPALIVRPRSSHDVAAAVLHAREHGLELAVRCGGHSVPGYSMADGGLTIDLSELNRVQVDPVTRRASVQGGSLLGDVARATAPHDLAMPYGHISHTGVGGLTLGGGIGWIMRRCGLAVDALRSVELVDAEGELVRASEEENPDLFWAVRGGGGNFGVVTEFDFELHPHGPAVLAGMVLHPLDRAVDALRFSRDFMDEAPDALTVYEVFISVPPAPPFPDELHGRPALALGLVYAGDPEEGERVVRPLRAFGSPALDLVGPMPNLAVQEMLDPTAPHGMRNYNKAHWLTALPDAAVEELVALHARVTSPLSQIITARMGGAVARVPGESTAFGHRDAYRLLWIVSSWWEGEGAEHVSWCREVFDALARYSTGGVYVNALGAEGQARVRAAYGEKAWNRLVAVKDRWDPDNVFRLNYNIPPSGEPAASRTA